jgi:SAM-dependent methyltransferase
VESEHAPLPSLEELGYKYGSDKSRDDHGYVKVYADLFEPIRTKPLSILEVGIATGQSLQMWQDYFPKADIKGIDITVNQLARQKFTNSPRVKLYETSSQDKAAIDNLGIPAGSVDIIIDDGDHSLKGQERTLAAMWHLLRPGGHYIVEDILWNQDGQTKEEQMRNPYLHPEMLEQSTNDILELNDAFFTDVSLGHRSWDKYTQVSSTILERDIHDSHLAIIHRRDRPLPPVKINLGSVAMIGL